MHSGEEPPKVVVFDLDETLGYFTEFAIFFDIVIKYAKIKPRLHQKVFNILLDLYPEYLRPHIIFILTFLKSKKKLQNLDTLKACSRIKSFPLTFYGSCSACAHGDCCQRIATQD